MESEKFYKVIKYKSFDWLVYLTMGIINLLIHFSSTPYTNPFYFTNLGISGFPKVWMLGVIILTLIMGVTTITYSIFRFFQVRDVYWKLRTLEARKR